MNRAQLSPQARFAAVVAALVNAEGVAPPEPGQSNKFGSSGLKVHGKIFAMLVRDRLVVKLPRRRIDALISAEHGERFDPRHDGRLMQEWLVLAPSSDLDWLTLATEAMQFVGRVPRR
jgi:hypothetical protein